MKELIFKPQFTDRAGRMVYHIHERSGEKRYYSPGALIGMARFTIGSTEPIEIEWLSGEDDE
jgi:hypothetical protein